MTAASLSFSEKVELLKLLEAKKHRDSGRKIWRMYPDDGPLRRELYHKHLAFFEAGLTHRIRCALAANRVGKTEGMGGYEMSLHLTGQYPFWWSGHRFDKPIRAWAAGDTGKTVRDIIQNKLLGEPGAHGTGLLPRDTLVRTTPKPGVPDAVETVVVKHVSGGNSRLVLKSYDQGRISFQGTEQDIIWLDEEPPMDIYTECLTRLMTTDGLLMATFTPLEGLSEVVLAFCPGGVINEESDVFVIQATWDDVPHLSQEQKAKLWDSIPPYQRDARSKGIPQLGSGAIYPVPETDIKVDPFEIPAHWRRAFGMDVGWNRTANVWGAEDPDSGVWYLYSEHYRGHAEPTVHADGIRARGEWIPGAIDPAARGRSQADGVQLLQKYVDLGLVLTPAKNGVESGLYEVWQLLSSGRLKVFSSLSNWFAEYRLYRRDERGRVVKENDHAMDATRYFVTTGRELAITEPSANADARYNFRSQW